MVEERWFIDGDLAFIQVHTEWCLDEDKDETSGPIKQLNDEFYACMPHENIKVSKHSKIRRTLTNINKEDSTMKTIDAVNEFKGEWLNGSCCAFMPTRDNFKSHGFKGFFAKTAKLGVNSYSGDKLTIGGYHVITSAWDKVEENEFNTLVQERSHHAGIELFNEYVKSDKKLLEKESKVDYTSEEFWKDAPEGATHYKLMHGSESGSCWYMAEKDKFASMYDAEWCCTGWYSNDVINNNTGRYNLSFIHRPKPQPIFTKAMSDNGEFPAIGMEVSFDRMIVTIVGYTLKGMPVFEMPNGMVDSFNSNNSYRPIDTRSDREKAIDYMSKRVFVNKECLSVIYDEWSGNNE